MTAAVPLHWRPGTETTWKIFSVCGIAAVGCNIFFRDMQHHINTAAAAAGFAGEPSELLVPDLCFGYTPQQLASLFGAWGAWGRTLYIGVELVDVLVYFAAYAGALLIVLNTLAAVAARRTGLGFLRRASWLAPLALVALDVVEDALQLLLVLRYDEAAGPRGQPGWWSDAARAASDANQAKWWAVRGTVGFLLLLAAAAALPGGRRAPKPAAGDAAAAAKKE